jgi:hypothetical protein
MDVVSQQNTRVDFSKEQVTLHSVLICLVELMRVNQSKHEGGEVTRTEHHVRDGLAKGKRDIEGV